MDHYKVVRVFLAFSIVTSFISTEARANTISTEEEDVHLGNRVGVHTMKTDYGSIYDCVNIYRQPALDHPQLKGHKIQMRPSFAVQNRPSSIPASSKFGLKDKCPRGTVPILRMTMKERLKAESSFTNDFQPSSSGISTVPNNNKKYHGAGGFVNTQNPSVEKGQFSSSVISIEGGPPEEFSNIRVGWMVNPNLFGDNLTRLYTLWGQGVNGTIHGCYDTRCPGFVLVSPDIPPNLVLYDIKNPVGKYDFLNVNVTQDTVTGNWWLEFFNKEEVRQIGYWPSSLFTNLKDGADVLRWGGVVYSDKPQSPPMGSGGRDCYFWRLSLVDPVGGDSSHAPLETSESRCYRVGDNSYKNESLGYSFWFGGPGGDTRQCN